MKKLITIIFLLIVTLAFFDNANSQTFRINGYGFYTLDDDVEAVNGNNYFRGTVKAGALWGGGFEFNAMKDYGVEIAYFRQDTDFPVNYYTGVSYDKSFSLGINYIMFGVNRYIVIPKSPFEPFGGVMIGAAILENKDPLPGAESSTTKFAWQIKAGVNIMATKQFGFKLQAHVLSAVQSVGGGFYLGTGGTSAGLTTNSSMLQVGFGGGLVFKFGKNL